MRALIVFTTVLAAGPAFAHVGHLGEVAGHSHWIGAAAAAAAAAIAVWAGLKGRDKEGSEAEAEPETQDDAPQEA